MEVNTIQLAGKFAGLFSSGALLIIGSAILIRSLSFDYDTVIYACKVSLAGAVVAGLIGHIIGKTFEKSAYIAKKSESHNDEDVLIKDVLDNELSELIEDN